MKDEHPYRRRSKITVPEHAHPLARLVFTEMRRQCLSYDDLEWSSGILRSSIKAWRQSNVPSLTSIEAALGALGWLVLPVPKPETLPPALRADLEEVAAKHSCSELPALELISSCSAYPFHRPIIDARTRRQHHERIAA